VRRPDWKLNRRKIALLVGAIALAFTIVLVFQNNFASTLDSWLSGLVMWIARGGRDIDPLLLLRTPRGRCGLVVRPAGTFRIADVRCQRSSRSLWRRRCLVLEYGESAG